MKKHLVSLLATISMIIASMGLLPAQPAFGIDVFNGANGACTGGGGSGSAKDICGASQDDFKKIMKTIINTALVVIGMIAVIMIVIGGVKYVVSNGEAQQIQSAKNTILYSVIGLVIAVSAFPIVNFVLDKFK